MTLPVLLQVSLHLFGASVASGAGAWVPPPFTLRPRAPLVGETLLCVVEAAFRDRPDLADSPGTIHAAGDSVRVTGRAEVSGVPWVATFDGWVPAAYLDRPPLDTPPELPVGREGMVAGRILPAGWQPDDLRDVPDSLKVADVAWRRMRLRAGALAAFGELIAAARRDGVRIELYSAYRSGEYQRPIYAKYVAEDPNQRLSAAPGRSEHQLGTTADVATPDVPPLRTELAGAPAGRWLAANAPRFGIVATFSRDRHAARGVAWEPWHLRWVGANVDREEDW